MGPSYVLSQHSLLLFCLSEDVLKSLQSDFMSHVDAKAIASDARRGEIVPERVETEILHAKTKDVANDYLFQHLCSQATPEDLRKLCSIMEKAKGFSKMIAFGKALQAELEKVSSKLWQIEHTAIR